MSDKVLVSSSAFSDRDRHPTLAIMSILLVRGWPSIVGLERALSGRIGFTSLSRNLGCPGISPPHAGGIPCGGGLTR